MATRAAPPLEAGIRQLHRRYVDAVWRKDAAAVAQCYVPQGEWCIAGQVLRGHRRIAEAFTAFVAVLDGVHMRARIVALHVDDGEVRGHVRIRERVQARDGACTFNIGVYDDVYVCSGGAWHFQRRAFTLLRKRPANATGRRSAG